MTTKQRIASKLRKKNWALANCEFIPITYNGPQGREGGWEIEFETLIIGDDIAFDESIIDENDDLIRNMKYDLSMAYILLPGFINAYNNEDVFKIIDMMPVAKPITGSVVDGLENLVNKNISE